MIHSSNPVVQNALNAMAMNMPWTGNPYKCPWCGSTNGWTYTGVCKKCRRKLDAHDQAQRINEIVRRKLSVNNPQDIRNLAEISGVPVDILRGKLGRGRDMEHGSGALKMKQKHSGDGAAPEMYRRGDAFRIGFTLTYGKHGQTTKGSKVGGETDPKRSSVVRGTDVAFLEKYGKGRLRLTTGYRGGKDAAREEKIHKTTRRT